VEELISGREDHEPGFTLLVFELAYRGYLGSYWGGRS
jgi:hypothetical protein